MRFDWVLQICILASSRAIHGVLAIGDGIKAIDLELKKPGEDWNNAYINSCEGNHSGLDGDIMEDKDPKLIQSDSGKEIKRKHEQMEGRGFDPSVESSKRNAREVDRELQHSRHMDSTKLEPTTGAFNHKVKDNSKAREGELKNDAIMESQPHSIESSSIPSQARGIGTSTSSTGLTHDTLEIQRKAAIEAVEQCSQMAKDMAQWQSDFSQMSMYPDERISFKKHVDVVRNSMGQILTKKMYQLRRNPYVLEGVPDDVSNKIFELADRDWLKNIADLEPAVMLLNRLGTRFAKLLLIRWCDLMTKFFSDLKQHEIITIYSLNSFLNRYNKGQFILSYVNVKMFPHNSHNVYLNFNLKLSLQENSYGTQMANVLECEPSLCFKVDCISIKTRRFLTIMSIPPFPGLDHKTWKQIEFHHLISCVKNCQVQYPDSTDLHITDILDAFRASNDSTNLLETMMDDLFDTLVNYISSIIVSQDATEPMDSSKLLKLKIWYNTYTYFVSYHIQDISAGCMKKFKESRNFSKVLLFEETVGLVASLYHSAHVNLEETQKLLDNQDKARKKNEVLAAIRYIWYNPMKLTDSNKNRRVSSLDDYDIETEFSPLFNAPAVPLGHQDIRSQGLGNSCDKISILNQSILKVHHQYQRYLYHFTKLNLGKSSLSERSWKFVDETLEENVRKMSRLMSYNLSRNMLDPQPHQHEINRLVHSFL
ncbi:hypothetical protein PSTT_12699, partial [Puccinia striiformis]